MDPVLVKKALMDSGVVLRIVKVVAMPKHLYVHHVRKHIMETLVMTDVQVTVRMAVLRMKEYVKNVFKDTGETAVIKVRNIFITVLNITHRNDNTISKRKAVPYKKNNN